MEVTSPINSIWRVCTMVSFISGVFLLFINQGDNQFLRTSLKPESMSISISAINFFPMTKMHQPSDPLAVNRNETLEDVPVIKKNETHNRNETLEDVPVIKKNEIHNRNETLEDVPVIKKNETHNRNETLEDVPVIKKNETLNEDRDREGKNGGEKEDNYCDIFDGIGH